MIVKTKGKKEIFKNQSLFLKVGPYIFRELELCPLESLSELPIGRGDVVARHRPSVAGGHLKGEALAVKHAVALPILPPISRHLLPSGGPGPLHGDGAHVSESSHVTHQNQVEIRVAVDREPDPALLPARHPAEVDGDDPGPVDRDLQVRGLRHVEVGPGRVAPPAVVVGQSRVRRAEIGGGDGDGGAGDAVGAGARDLVAGAARQAIVEQSRA